jgi:hypothetical protein
MIPQNPDDYLREVEAMANKHQPPPSERHECERLRADFETRLRHELAAVYPYSLAASELGRRLGIPWASQILAYLALFGIVERGERRGTYHHVPKEGGEA